MPVGAKFLRDAGTGYGFFAYIRGMKKFKVMKFGGTSVGSAERMKEVARLVTGQGPVLVVLSAMSGVTNTLEKICELARAIRMSDILDYSRTDALSPLINLAFPSPEMKEIESLAEELRQKYISTARELLPEGSEELYEALRFISVDHGVIMRAVRSGDLGRVMASGEMTSTALFHSLLESQGLNAEWLNALDFMSNNVFNESKAEYTARNISPRLEAAETRGTEILVTQGYICRRFDGKISNFGRGGSDYSATLLGAALEASEVQIWTDIDGVHTSDPRVVPGTRPVPKLSYEQAEMLALCGAKILHPDCVSPCKDYNVPIRVLCTMDPSAPGTLISDEPATEEIAATALRYGLTQNTESSKWVVFEGFQSVMLDPPPADLAEDTPVAVVVAVGRDSKVAEKYLEEKLRDLPVIQIRPYYKCAAIAVVPQSEGATALRAIAPK